jgi:hypothetical protein
VIHAEIDSSGSNVSSNWFSATTSGITNSEFEAEGITEGQVSNRFRQRGTSLTDGVSRNRTRTRGSNVQEAFVTVHNKRRVPINIQYLSEQEFLTMRVQQLMQLGEGEFCLKVPGKKAIFLTAPLVDPFVTRKQREQAIARITERPAYTPLKEIVANEQKASALRRGKDEEFRPESVWTNGNGNG